MSDPQRAPRHPLEELEEAIKLRQRGRRREILVVGAIGVVLAGVVALVLTLVL